MNDHEDGRWKVDKHIPIALIITISMTILGQTATAFWWASRTDSRLEFLELAARSTPNQGDRLVRVEVKLEAMTERLSEIKQLLTSRPRGP